MASFMASLCNSLGNNKVNLQIQIVVNVLKVLKLSKIEKQQIITK